MSLYPDDLGCRGIVTACAYNHDELQCPPELRGCLGAFDLDPCASGRPVAHLAERNLTLRENGLAAEWQGRVWLFPPVRQWEQAAARMAEHGNGIALLPAETDRPAFGAGVHLYLFLPPTKYHLADGRLMQSTLAQPMVLAAYSEADAQALRQSGIRGLYLQPGAAA